MAYYKMALLDKRTPKKMITSPTDSSRIDSDSGSHFVQTHINSTVRIAGRDRVTL